MFKTTIPENKYYSGIKGIKLYPTEYQRIVLDSCIEGYRRVYNWALYKEIEQFNLFNKGLSDRQFLSFIDLQNMYPEYRKTDQLLLDVPSHSMMNAIKDLVQAYELFFRNKNQFNKPKIKNNTGLFCSYKPRSEKSSFYFKGYSIRIEGLKYGDTIATSFTVDTDKCIDPVIKRNNRTKEYFLSFKILKDKKSLDLPITDAIGVDVNRQNIYACSNGFILHSRDISSIRNHLNDLNRQVDRDRKNHPDNVLSNRALDRLNKRKRLYERIANIHRDLCYNGSLEIIKNNPEAVILESLDIYAIMKKHYIADDLMTNPLGVSQEILANQCFKYNIPVVYAPVEFESSNYCSNCGSYKNIQSSRFFVCDCCGLRLDRDINAAINLKQWYQN